MTSVTEKTQSRTETPGLPPSPVTLPSSDAGPKKRRHAPPKQAFVLLALVVAAGLWWLYTELTAAPANGITASGTIESEEVNIASEVPGRVVQLLADEGDQVQQNQLLARLDDSTLQLQYRMAGSETERQLLEAQIAKTSIRSPMAGTVSRRSVRAGEVTSAGATLMVVTSTDPVDLTIYVPERSIGQVSVGQRVDVQVDSFPGQHFTGRVTFISPRAEFTPRNVQTQKDRMNLVFGVKVQIPNGDGRLKPGMPADANFVLSPGS
ncbi:MAG TPA: efflux RND transporter periplasmic adaptor subunit [Chloroflexota bacterium]